MFRIDNMSHMAQNGFNHFEHMGERVIMAQRFRGLESPPCATWRGNGLRYEASSPLLLL